MSFSVDLLGNIRAPSVLLPEDQILLKAPHRARLERVLPGLPGAYRQIFERMTDLHMIFCVSPDRLLAALCSRPDEWEEFVRGLDLLVAPYMPEEAHLMIGDMFLVIANLLQTPYADGLPGDSLMMIATSDLFQSDALDLSSLYGHAAARYRRVLDTFAPARAPGPTEASYLRSWAAQHQVSALSSLILVEIGMASGLEGGDYRQWLLEAYQYPSKIQAQFSDADVRPVGRLFGYFADESLLCPSDVYKAYTRIALLCLTLNALDRARAALRIASQFFDQCEDTFSLELASGLRLLLQHEERSRTP